MNNAHLAGPYRPTLQPLGISGEELIEVGYYALDSKKDVIQMLEHTQVSAKGLLENYVRHQRCVHFHFDLGRPHRKLDLGKYCAVFKGAISMKRRDALRTCRGFYGELRAEQVPLNHCEQFVFISRVQFFKQPERLLFGVRSLVRLERLNRGRCSFMYAFRMALEPPSIWGIQNRKGRIPISRAATSASPSDVVERGARVMYAIPDDQRPARRRHRFDITELKQILGLFVCVSSDSAEGLRIDVGPKFVCKGFQMFGGAPDFVPAFA